MSVQQLVGTISFASDSVSKTYGNSAFTNVLTNTGDGAVTYSSSNTSVATVNSSGQVTIKGAGSATITATVADSSAYHYPVNSVSYALSVAKANPVYTAPAAQSLTYSGSSQYLTTSGSTSHGTIQYSLDGATWTTTRSSATSAGSYTTYWRLVGDSNHNDVASTSISTTIAKKTLTITAKAQTITYGGSIATGTSQVTTSGLVSGDSLTAVTLTASTSSVTTSGTITPSAATTSKGISNYSVTYNTGNLTINKADSSVTAAPTAKTGLKYTGSGQALVNAGTASGGTMYYKATTTNSKPTSTSGFSSSIPTGTSVGTYYVWYYVAGDSNHNNTAISSTAVSVSIAQATGSISFIASSMAATRTGTILGITVTALNSGWEKTTAKTVSGYNVFRSCSNKGENNSFSVLKLQFVNNTGSSITTTVKMGPTCESSYDFSYIAAWNASDITSNTVPSSPLWSGSGKTAEWTDVSLTIPTGTNTLQIVYRKDNSVNNSPDCGYLAIPFDINFSTMLNHITKTGDGAVTYSSNKTSVATVNSSTGVITIKGTGTATITASMAATTNSTAASATFTVTVASSSSCTEALTVSITKDAGSGSLSSASVAVKMGSTTLTTLSSGGTANIAWNLNYTLVANDISGYEQPASVTKNWTNTTSKSVTMTYTYIPYKIVVSGSSEVVQDSKTVVVNI